jgi:MFS superfamily sulfate permease-like transporter
MICAIFAGVVLAVFLFYRRTIRHYGVERVDRSVEKERRMSLVLILQPSESQ